MNFKQLKILSEHLENTFIINLDDECITRSSASHLYYYLFHFVREIFEKNFSYEYEASGGGTHQALQVCCSILSEKLSSKDFSKLEMKLRMLHQLRVKADYKLDAPFSKGDLLTMKLEQDKAEKLLIELIKNVS